VSKAIRDMRVIEYIDTEKGDFSQHLFQIDFGDGWKRVRCESTTSFDEYLKMKDGGEMTEQLKPNAEVALTLLRAGHTTQYRKLLPEHEQLFDHIDKLVEDNERLEEELENARRLWD